MKNNQSPIIVVACDSMKGSLSSLDVAAAAAEGIHCVYPEAEVRRIGVADGGEGTMRTLVDEMQGEMVDRRFTGPLGLPVDARYGWVDSVKMAVIEMAEAAGLTLVPADSRNPLMTTTYGVGELMLDALNRGARHILVCIGGSATNDGGTGMLQALGVRFLDRLNNPLPGIGDSLESISSIDITGLTPALKQCRITVACDVDNPLYGPRGAAHVFARQKGADDSMIEILDRGLSNYAEAILDATGRDVADLPGAGAAGGVGAGLVGILGARLQSGVETVLEAIDFDSRLRGASLVITGEGRIDSQTLGGKTPMGVLRHAAAMNIPTVAIAGSVEEDDRLYEYGFLAVLPIVGQPATLERCMEPRIAAANVRRTVAQIVRLYFK